MLLSSLALLAALGLVALLVVTARTTVRVTSHAEEVRRRTVRAAEMRAEAARLAAIRSETVAGAVDIGSAVARLGHETVAGLSFRLLDLATGGRTRTIKRRHDSIARAVYGAISEATDELRGRGAGAPPAVPAPPPAPPRALPPTTPED